MAAAKKYAKRVAIVVVALIVLSMAGCPYYNVWEQGMAGKAALMKATQDRQIAVQEAEAKKESAASLAEAEVIRAGGVARANKIIGDSLKNNEAYLRYLWVDGLQQTKNQVIYVPTEANLPVMEATRLKGE
ncbi:membrane protease subunit [Salmonella enterica]|nr:membrane protease subunit [Salmonella enterica]